MGIKISAVVAEQQMSRVASGVITVFLLQSRTLPFEQKFQVVGYLRNS